MKRHILPLFFAILPLLLSGREVIPLNRNWKFYYAQQTDSDGAMTVNLPHTWNTGAPATVQHFIYGTGIYEKELHIPSSWADKRIFIRTGGANKVATVFINGRYAGEHRGGYTAFALEITGLIQTGRRNIIQYTVDNSFRNDVLPTAGDENCYGGLFREVELIVAEKNMISVTDHGGPGLRIVQERITEQQADLRAVLSLSLSGNCKPEVVISVYDGSMRPVTEIRRQVRDHDPAGQTVEIPVKITDPHLWRGKEGAQMYVFTALLTEGGRIIDSTGVRTGLRTVGCDGQGNFLLNGRPYAVRGVAVVPDRAIHGNALTPEHLRQDIELIKEIGATAVRTATLVHHPEFYEMCDREGILVWCDLPFTGARYLTDRGYTDSPSFRENGLQQATEIVTQLYNHPSIVAWGVFSEQNYRNDDPTAYIGTLNSTVKSLDRTRLTSCTSNEDGDINFITDLVTWEHHFGWKDGIPSDINLWCEQFRTNWTNLNSGVSYNIGGSVMHQGEELTKPDPTGSWHTERWQTHAHDTYLECVSAEGGFWGIFAGHLFDYGANRNLWGEANGINGRGLITMDRQTRKDAFYLYKANWNTGQPFVHLTERRWTTRRSTNQKIVGYTNLPEGELFVNGTSAGHATAAGGKIVWDNVKLDPGPNTIVVRCGEFEDRITVTINPGNSARELRERDYNAER